MIFSQSWNLHTGMKNKKEDLKQMNRKQALNPFLPLDEYIPDGEPHVFGDRVYLYGSHDTEGGTRYCSEGNYVCYSAPVSDLTDWKYEGVIFEASQSPGYTEGEDYDLYAPDVVQGNDGRYYLYYNKPGFHNDIYVAVCDTPAGKYEYYGFVKNPDGSAYREYLDGDPAVLNDDGTIRLYCGWSLSMVAAEAHRAGEHTQEQTDSAQGQSAQTPVMPEPGSEAMKQMLKPVYQMMFHRKPEETDSLEYPLMGANALELEDDMLTVRGKTHRIVPGQFDTPKDSSFYGHAFYEASSIRKINGMYYFIYSSENSNELCYATSKYPDRDFTYGGTIISNGDVGYEGRKNEDRLNMTANNHGSLEYINGQWYVFYHRQTHNSTFSRQACAEPVVIAKDGSIAQVECTSCGLNRGPLYAKGSYPAPYACNLTNGHMPHATNTVVNADIPYITHDHDERFITNIKAGTMIGYKYFRLEGSYRLRIKTKGEGSGVFRISTDEAGKSQILGQVEIHPSKNWKESETVISAEGVLPLYLHYEGNGSVDLLEIAFV